MELNEATFRNALDAYYEDRGTVEGGIRKAIETYLAEMFKPGELIVGEAIAPQRDYRKELWIDVAVSTARSDATTSIAAPGAWADRALADFDKTFPQEPTHG